MSTVSAAARRELTWDERHEKASKARVEQQRRWLSHFVRGAWSQLEGGELSWNIYIEALCFHLQVFFEGWLVANNKATKHQRERVIKHWHAHGLTFVEGQLLVQNLIVNMPPGTLKSRIIMCFFPAWVWLHDPTFTFLCLSSNDEVVKRDSEAHQSLIESAWYRETFEIGWHVKSRQSSVKKWKTTAGGTRISRTILSGMVGLHVDCIMIDDPEDPLRVFNEAERRKVQQKFTKAIWNRVNSMIRSLRILAQQRVHAEDLTGYCRANMKWAPTSAATRGGWMSFVVPMEGGKGPKDIPAHTAFGWGDARNDNDVIDPALFTPAILELEKRQRGSHGFEAQYNQNAEAIDGGWFSRAFFRFFLPEQKPGEERDDAPRRRPDGCVQLPGHGEGKFPEDSTYELKRNAKTGQLELDFFTISVDASFGSTNEKTASNVGMLAIGGKGILRFIFADRSRPMTFLDTLDVIRELIAQYPARRVLVEFKANGPAVIEQLKKDLRENKLIGPEGKPVAVVVEDFQPGQNSKHARARAMLPDLEAGTVFLLEGAVWLEDFLKELCVFPNAKRDDRVDALSQAMLHYSAANSNVSKAKAMAAW